MADASIRVQTKIDLNEFKKLNAEVDRLNKKFEKQKSMGDTNQRLGIKEDSLQMRRLDIETRKTYEALQKARKELQAFNAQHDMTKINSEDTKKDFEDIKESATPSFKAMNDNAKKSTSLFGQLGKRIKGLALRVFIFSLITKAFRSMVTSMQDGLKNLALFSDKYNRTMSDFKSSTAELKNSLATAVEPIINMIVPYLTQMVDALTEASNELSMFFSALSGSTTFTKAKKQMIDYANSVDKAKSALASFDDIQVLQNDSGETTGADAFETANIDERVLSFASNVKLMLQKIKDTFNQLKPTFTYLKDSLLVPIANILGNTVTSAIESVRKLFKNLAKEVGEHWESIQKIINVAKKNIELVVTVFKIQFQYISGFVSGLVDVFAVLFGDVVDILGNIIDFVKNVFTGQWENAWTSVKNIFSGIWEAIKNLAFGIINAIIDGINKISFDVPDWAVFGDLGGKHFGFDIDHIGENSSTSGIVTGNTTGSSIYDNEARKRAHQQSVSTADTTPSTSTNVNINFEGSLSQLAKVLKPSLDKESSRVGTTLTMVSLA